jgi:hypothetical protein
MARDAAYARVEAAINVLGPHLFSLITTAEERISGTRPMPRPAGQQLNPRGDRYELTGIADVISNVSVETNGANAIVQLINTSLAGLAPPYDLIVDYKAARRPSADSPYWDHHEWQIQTYAWLRSQIPNATRVGAGLLIYVNELSPSQTDLRDYLREIANQTTDVVPENGSADYYAIHRWQPGAPVPPLSETFLLSRAIRVIDVSPEPVQAAVNEIDEAVLQIEQSALAEHNSGNIPNNWNACGRQDDCVACDFYHSCPDPADRRGRNLPRPSPAAPG